MRCLHEDKPCPYRKWIEKDGKGWWNCQWYCPFMEDCRVAIRLTLDGFAVDVDCPYFCIYEALEHDSECPFKDKLKQKLEEDLKKQGGQT